MTELPRLTLAFLQSHPASAARTIETLAPQDAAALLEHVPVRISAPVFTAMTSLAGARCVARLPHEVGAALCETLSWADASAILRQLDPQSRTAVLAQLPTAMGRRFKRSLEYTENEVGAWIEMDAPAIIEDRSVGDALRLLAVLPDSAASHVLLTDTAQRYTGIVAVAALLSASATAGLETLAQRSLRPVRDSASLGSVADHSEWDVATLLPVVNHRGELMGGLSRKTLRKALPSQGRQAAPAHRSMLAHMLDAYLVAAEGLLRLLLQAPAGNGRDRVRRDS